MGEDGNQVLWQFKGVDRLTDRERERERERERSEEGLLICTN